MTSNTNNSTQFKKQSHQLMYKQLFSVLIIAFFLFGSLPVSLVGAENETLNDSLHIKNLSAPEALSKVANILPSVPNTSTKAQASPQGRTGFQPQITEENNTPQTNNSQSPNETNIPEEEINIPKDAIVKSQKDLASEVVPEEVPQRISIQNIADNLIITLNDPVNEDNITDMFNFTLENATSLVNCAFIGNWSGTSQQEPIGMGQSTNLGNGTYLVYPLNLDNNATVGEIYEWQIACMNSGNPTDNKASSLETFTYQAPSENSIIISLIGPTNNANVTGMENLTYMLSSDPMGDYNCGLFVNNTLNATANNITGNNTIIETEIGTLGLDFGNHSWYVNCSNAGNATQWNLSETRNFNFTMATMPGPQFTSAVTHNGTDEFYFDGEEVFFFVNVSNVGTTGNVTINCSSLGDDEQIVMTNITGNMSENTVYNAACTVNYSAINAFGPFQGIMPENISATATNKTGVETTMSMSTLIVAYNFTTPTSPFFIFGPGTTNFSTIENFQNTNISFDIRNSTNRLVELNFTGLDLDDPIISSELVNLGISIMPNISTFSNMNSSIYLNSSALSLFNTSAIIEAFNLPYNETINIISPNGGELNTSFNITYDGENLTFQVEHFSTYVITQGETLPTELSSCPGDNLENNTNYIMINNFTNASTWENTWGNCFNPHNKENIEINCDGYTISGNSTSKAFLLNVFNNNITIKNCVINTLAIPVFIEHTHNSTFENLTIMNYNNVYDAGIYFDNGTYNTFSNNNIDMEFENKSGLVVVDAQHTIIENNIFSNLISNSSTTHYIYAGILIGHNDSQSNSVENTTIRYNTFNNVSVGLKGLNMNGATSYENQFYNVSGRDVDLGINTTNNLFYNNTFTHNGTVWDNGIGNKWNNSVTGNHWVGYDGVQDGLTPGGDSCEDNNFNGLCDIPYSISGTAGSQDYKAQSYYTLEPSIYVYKDTLEDNYTFGDVITYEIYLENDGDYNLTNIIVKDIYNSEELHFLNSNCNSTASNESAGNESYVQFNISDCYGVMQVEPDTNATFFINMSSRTGGLFTNNVLAKAIGNGEEVNDTSNAEADILGTVAFNVTKTLLNQGPIQINDTLMFMINMTNSGNDSTDEFFFGYDNFNSSMLNFSNANCAVEFINQSGDNGELDFNLTTCNNGQVIRPNESVVLYVNFTALALGNTTNSFSVEDDESVYGDDNETAEIIHLEGLSASNPEFYNGTGWDTIANLDYGEEVQKVRVTCSNQINQSQVTTASFFMENIPDSNITINGTNATSNSSTVFELDMADFTVLDSGNWNLTATCILDNTTTSQTESTHFVPWGTLSLNIINSGANSQVQKDDFFTLNTSITCTGGECQDVNVFMDPKESLTNKNKASKNKETHISRRLVNEVQSQIDENTKTAVIVKLKETSKGKMSVAAQKDSFSLSTSKHIKIKDEYQSFNLVTVIVDEKGLQELIANDLVESIEPVRRMHATMNTVNPIIGSNNMWTHQIDGTNITGDGVTVCVIDTGINYSHPDFNSHATIPNDVVIGSQCYVDDYNLSDEAGFCPNGFRNSTDVMDDEGHGSHVAGIIASRDATYTGVAPDAKLVVVKALDYNGYGWNSDIIKGINWCVTNKDVYNISIISMSIGGDGYNSVADCEGNYSGFTAAINTAYDDNITVIVASGNQQENASYYNKVAAPACIGSAISVGAVDNNDLVAPFTQAGPLLDMLAPGYPVTATNYLGGHIPKSGTSMATPVVSGMAALLTQYKKLEYNRPTYPSELKNVLLANGVDIDDGANSGYNYTRINIADANNITGWDTKGLISTTPGTTPFYTTNNNPQNDSTEAMLSSMHDGEVKYVSWNSNASGDYSTWEFFAYANDITTTEVQSNHFNVEIYDSTIPTISQVSPVNNNASNANTQTFQFNASDNYDTNLTCALYINNSLSNSTSATVNTLSSISYSLSEGIYSWHINCSDAYGNSVASETRTIMIDTSIPQYTNLSVTPNGVVDFNAPTNITISANWSDNNLQNVSLYFGNNDSLISTQTSSGGIITFHWEATAVNAESNITFYMIARDSLNENTTVNTSHVYLRSAPYITNSIPNYTMLEDKDNMSYVNVSNVFRDYNNASLIYSVRDDNTAVVINETAGILSINATNNYFGIVHVNVSASDGMYNITDYFIINVTSVNDPPTITGPIQNFSIDEAGENLSVANLSTVFNDVETSELTFVVSDNETAVLTGETNNILYANTTGDFYGVVEINITAIDEEGANVTDTVLLTVQNVNDAPIITSNPITRGKTNYRYTYQVTASDADPNDVLNFSLITSPTNMIINSTSGLINWNVNNTIANYTINVNVSDGNGAWDNQSYLLEILGSAAVNTLTESNNIINKNLNGTNVTFLVEYTYEMNISVHPTITFTPSCVSTLSCNTGFWQTDNLTINYTCLVTDSDVELSEVNVSIENGIDKDGQAADNYSESNVFSIDTIAPKVTIARVVPETTKTNGSVTVEVIFSENMNTTAGTLVNITGLTRTYQVGATSFTLNNFTGTFNLLDDNEDNVANIAVYNAQDAAGNAMTSANTSAGTFDIDTFEPTLSNVSISSNNTNSNMAKVGDNISLTFTASETLIATPIVSIDGNTASVESNGLNYSAWYLMQSGDAEGTLGFTIDFTDAVGNVGIQVTSTSDNSSTIFDKTAPSFSANTETPTNPAIYSSGANYTFVVNISENNTTTSTSINFDGTTSTNITSNTNTYSYATSNLAVGTYNYNWTATDAAGNTNVSSTYTYTINKATPTLNLSIVKDNITYGENITAICSANTVQVSPDILVNGTSQGTTSYNEQLTVGMYNITCTSASTQNYSTTQEEHIVVVNKANPNLTLLLDGIAANSNKYVDTNITINASINATQGIMNLYLDNVLINSGEGPLENITTLSTAGILTVLVNYTETANYSADSINLTVNVTDNVKPLISLVGPTNNSWATINPINFTYNASDVHSSMSRCQVYVDGSLKKTNLSVINESATNSIARTTNAGIHTWKIRCYDSAGNYNDSKTRVIRVDTQKPTTSAPGLYNEMIVGTNINITLTADDSGASGLNYTEYKIDSGNWTKYNNSFERTVSGTLKYRSVDLAGNIEETKTINYTIDKTAPSIEFIPSINGTQISGIKNINITSFGASYVNFKINSTQFDNVNSSNENYTTELITENYDNGNYIITATAYDGVGNVNSSSAIVIINNTPINTNTIAPTTTYSISSGTAGTNGWYTSDVVISLTASPGNDSSPINVTQWWNASGSVWLNSSVINLNESSASIKYRSIDNDSNVEENRTVAPIKIDKTKPVVVGLRIIPTIPRVNDTVTIFANLSDTISRLKTIQYIDIDGTQHPLISMGGVEYKYIFVPRTTATHTATIYAMDKAGNLNSTESIDYSISQQEVEHDYTFVNDSTNVNDFENEIDTSVEISVNESAIGNLTISRFAVAPEFVNSSLQYAATYMNYELSDNVDSVIDWILIKLYYTADDIPGIDESTLSMYWYNETSDSWVKLLNSMSFVNAIGVNTGENYVWANVTHFSTYSFSGSVVDCDDVLNNRKLISKDCYEDNGSFRKKDSGFLCDGVFQEDACEDNSTTDTNNPGGLPDDNTTTAGTNTSTTVSPAKNTTSSTTPESSETTINQVTTRETKLNNARGTNSTNTTDTAPVNNSTGNNSFWKAWLWILLIVLVVGFLTLEYFLYFKKWLRRRKLLK